MSHNDGVPKLLKAAIATVVSLVVAFVAVDFGFAIYAEYKLSRTIRAAAKLDWDPSANILGFPFVTQALGRRYHEVEIKANDVAHPHVGRASLEATMHDLDLTEASWLVRPDAPIPVDTLESRIIINSRYLGAFIGVKDLMVEAPPDTDDDTTTESGISAPTGLVFSGTPRSAGIDKRVSVSVDLSMVGPQQHTLLITPTGILTGPGTADQEVPQDRVAAVLRCFEGSLPDQVLPFGVAPSTQGARGSDVIIEGVVTGVTITLEGFTQP